MGEEAALGFAEREDLLLAERLRRAARLRVMARVQQYAGLSTTALETAARQRSERHWERRMEQDRLCDVYPIRTLLQRMVIDIACFPRLVSSVIRFASAIQDLDVLQNR